MKLELKHLAGYLPYGLLVTKNDWVNYMLLAPCSSYLADSKRKYEIGIADVVCFQAKPILHSLSDLTKEIEVNGVKFIPIEVLNSTLFTKHSKLEYYDSEFCKGAILFSSNIAGFNIISMQGKIEKLFEWHFDIYGLIEKGLAIDINTLK